MSVKTGSPERAAWTESDAANLWELGEVIETVQHVLRHQAAAGVDRIHDLPSAHEALTSTAAAVAREIREVSRLEGRPLDPDLAVLLHRVGRLGDAMRAAESSRHSRGLRDATAALSRFRDLLTVDEVVAEAAPAMCELGFDRSIVSRVDASRWVAEAVHVKGDDTWAQEILAAARRSPERLRPGLPELDVARRRRPILVTPEFTRSAIHRHRAIAQVSHCRSYVAAPVVASTGVVGFLHADRYFHAQDVTAFDRDLLACFAQGFGFVLERAVLLERLGEARRTALAFGISMGDATPEPSGASIWRSEAAALDPTRRSDTGAHLPLTRREREVLRLVADGLTNREIANRLTISDGTVKSHVKHVLHKLGAANRAEAVARWHEGQVR